MIDRGWRRSGTYCYQPDLRKSCCPQYAIKLDALRYKPSASQRKAINRWNRFILNGNLKDGDLMDVDLNESVSPSKKIVPGPRSKDSQEYSLITSIHASERKFIDDPEPAHNFEVTLEPPSYTDEKYSLFKSYQERIHNDDGNTKNGFKRFLVDSPLRPEPILYPSSPPDHLPKSYGTSHQMYRLDGKLIAIGVLDILPSCVSSVYFIYDNTWERFSLGKISAMREAALAREIHDAGIGAVDALYLGFYVHSCPKMKYKGDYSPSYLADPEDYTWWPFNDCSKLLEKSHYTSFAHPEHSLPAPDNGANLIPTFPTELLKGVFVVVNQSQGQIVVAPVNESNRWSDLDFRNTMLVVIDKLGLEISNRMVFQL